MAIEQVNEHAWQTVLGNSVSKTKIFVTPCSYEKRPLQLERQTAEVASDFISQAAGDVKRRTDETRVAFVQLRNTL